jgi:hypothetical protein
MNIFYLDKNPMKAAQYHVDKHCIKMILESAQLLSTAHHVLDGINVNLYKKTHVNHPSAIWVRQSKENYNWLYSLLEELINEYRYRFGKEHKTIEKLQYLKNAPANIPAGIFTEPTPAMPEEYVTPNDSVASYRKYYIEGKKHLFNWTNRNKPDWLP